MQNVDYIVMTAHFIDDKWKLQKRIIGFSEIDFQGIGDHTVGEYMFDCIFKKIRAWCVHKKLFCFAMGNARSDDIAVRKLNVACGNDDLTPVDGLFHVSCSPQTLNSMVLRSFETGECSGIKNSAKYRTCEFLC